MYLFVLFRIIYNVFIRPNFMFYTVIITYSYNLLLILYPTLAIGIYIKYHFPVYIHIYHLNDNVYVCKKWLLYRKYEIRKYS